MGTAQSSVKKRLLSDTITMSVSHVSGLGWGAGLGRCVRMTKEKPLGQRSMEDEVFIERIHRKIERMSGRSVELHIDREELNQLQVEPFREVPLVILGANVLHYSGFARMCIEYAVESIKQQRTIDMLEFHLLLARN